MNNFLRKPFRRLQLVDWMIVGVLVTGILILSLDLRHRENERVLQQLERQADVLQRSLDASLGRLDALLAANSSFLYSSSAVTDVAFSEFNSSLLGLNSAAQQVQWIEWIKHADRAGFERRMASESGRPFAIYEPGAGGSPSPAAVAADYLVIRYGVSRDNSIISRGLNVVFTPERRRRYEASAAGNTSMVSAVIPIFMVPADGEKSAGYFFPGVIVSRPVYSTRMRSANPPQRRTEVRGFVTILVKPESLLESAIDPLLETNVDAFVTERTPQGWRQFAHRGKHLTEPVSSSGPMFVSQPQDVLRTVKLLDQDWQLVVRPAQGVSLISRFDSNLAIFGGLLSVVLVLVVLTRHRSYQERSEQAREQSRRVSEIAALNDELEQRVALRTRELAESNQQLQGALNTLSLAQDELVRSEKLASLGSLVAGVAHELNTPIGNSVTVVSTLEQLLSDFAKDFTQGSLRRSRVSEVVERSQEAVVLISRNMHRAAELIANFKQVAVDQTSDRRRQFSLAATVAEIVQTINASARGVQHDIVVNIAADIVLDSFPGALGQVFLNLIENSRVHAFAPGFSGRINIDAHISNGNHVLINFSDNGSGIAAETLPRIFDPFFTTRLGQGGSGLGLHIVYGIVTRTLGGRIRVTSQPGLGSTFVIEIPLQAPIAARGAQAES